MLSKARRVDSGVESSSFDLPSGHADMEDAVPSDISVFDYTKLSDPEILSLYRRVMSVSMETATAIKNGYSPSMPIAAYFVDDEVFQASAGIEDGRYLVLFARPVPILVRILFDKILAHPALMPWLPSELGNKGGSDYDVPFIVDPLTFSRTENWGIRVNAPRTFAAGTLADICLCFIILHEFGHIICGHGEGVSHYYGRNHFLEFSASLPPSKLETERDRAWEFDADVVAATLMMQFIVELVADVDKNPRTKQFLGDAGDRVAQALSLAVAGLFALFSYLQGMRRDLGLFSSHPHPMVRAQYVKDLLVVAARERFSFDEDLFLQLMDERLNEMMIALQENGLFDASVFTDGYSAEIKRQKSELRALQAKYRSSCSDWCWFEWE